MHNFAFKQARRRRFGPFFIAMAAIVLAHATVTLVGAEPKTSTVRLVIDYGDNVQVHFTALAWHDGMTVLDALSAAQTHRHGIAFTHRGSGSTAMVTKIGDLKNEGDGRNWLYSVNDKKGEVSAGICKLQPRDAILWKFEVYDYNP
jgi:hypothetical protein